MPQNLGMHTTTLNNPDIACNQRIHDNVLECIGHTPLIRLNRIPKDAGLINCEVLVKCEFFNAGGSVKDRIAIEMIQSAELRGELISSKSTIIEPTSGNTGIGLALTSAVKGYNTIITLPEKMSDEKVNLLLALGAKVIRTPTEVTYNDPASHIEVAKRLKNEIDNSIILDQYSNPANPFAHYLHTAEEIIKDGTSDGKLIHMVVMGAGTGGTISGCARRLHEFHPAIKIIGVDPVGSILANSTKIEQRATESPISNNKKAYLVEGIGYDFVPKVLDSTNIDGWEKTSDEESFIMARELIKKEGLLCGGSSGSAMIGAIRAIKRFGMDLPGRRIIVILPDSIRNYMSKFLDDDWMISKGFALKSLLWELDDNVKKPETTQINFKHIKALVVAKGDHLKYAIEKIKGLDIDNINIILPVIINSENHDHESKIGTLNISKLFKKISLRELESHSLVDRFISYSNHITLEYTHAQLCFNKRKIDINQICRLFGTGRMIIIQNYPDTPSNNVTTIDSSSFLKECINNIF